MIIFYQLDFDGMSEDTYQVFVLAIEMRDLGLMGGPKGPVPCWLRPPKYRMEHALVERHLQTIDNPIKNSIQNLNFKISNSNECVPDYATISDTASKLFLSIYLFDRLGDCNRV